MSTTNNSEIISASEDKSLLRIINTSSPEGLVMFDAKKPPALECHREGKNCTNSSKIPRPPMTASYSLNETLKSNQSKGKTKQAPSMIPRSKSRNRNENDKVKFDVTSITDSLKNPLNDISTLNNKKSNTDMAVENSEIILSPDETLGKSRVQENKDLSLGQKLLKIDFVELVKKVSDVCKNVQEGKNSERRKISAGEQEETKSGITVENNGRDELQEEKTIQNLYETIKCTLGPAFDSFKSVRSESETDKLSTGAKDVKECEATTTTDFSSVQEHYEFTLKEISSIWKNTIGLILSVKDHVIQFVEENSKSVDKEQLILESEMLHLSLDLAISYSKLKSDSLVNMARERLKVKKLKKSDLENFIDSKTFSFQYSNDDMTAMARTVRDLNASIKSEDVELE